MNYREPAPREPEPLERLVVKRDVSYRAHLVFVVASLVVATGIYGDAHVECERLAPGFVARCTGGESALLTRTELAPFPLEPGSIRLEWPVVSRKKRSIAIVTPGGKLWAAAMDDEFAARVVSEADRFREDSERLEWREERNTWKLSLLPLPIGLLAIVLALRTRRSRTIVIDPNLAAVAVGAQTWSLHDIDDVAVAPLPPKGKDVSLMLELKGERVEIALGNPDTVGPAASALRRALLSRTEER